MNSRQTSFVSHAEKIPSASHEHYYLVLFSWHTTLFSWQLSRVSPIGDGHTRTWFAQSLVDGSSERVNKVRSTVPKYTSGHADLSLWESSRFDLAALTLSHPFNSEGYNRSLITSYVWGLEPHASITTRFAYNISISLGPSPIGDHHTNLYITRA